jgi:hypothetical protein
MVVGCAFHLIPSTVTLSNTSLVLKGGNEVLVVIVVLEADGGASVF